MLGHYCRKHASTSDQPSRRLGRPSSQPEVISTRTVERDNFSVVILAKFCQHAFFSPTTFSGARKDKFYRTSKRLPRTMQIAGVFCDRVHNRQIKFLASLVQRISSSRPYEFSGQAFWQIDGR